MSTVHAPDLSAGIAWLNTDRPLHLNQELRGQVVVLDFWTYCCINCMHILPDLAYLEHKYANDPVMFIGVHSAKFTNEADSETIRQAILRYEIHHPVVVDDNMKLWRAYTVRSWPTVVVIDPRGYVLASVAGEGNREILDQTIAQALEQGRSAGSLAKGPLDIQRESLAPTNSGLAFPGKVLADSETGLLFVADSNHNRIVIAELPDAGGRSRVVKVVGSGANGRADGPAESATFNHPQGLAAAHGNLYVADTENHLIRAIDLSSFEVTTVVGTGEMVYDRAGGLMGTQQGINSPWDLCIEGSTLYCAMAGEHQIWRIDLPVGFARALAGTGRENLADGPTETSAFAQPSGICLMGGNLYIADSEVSAIRGIDMAAERVFTVIGQGLFTFGDVDGVHPKARLQHPLGVAAWGMSLVVADTYNHKIKLVDPKARSVRTLYGGRDEGTQGLRDEWKGHAMARSSGVAPVSNRCETPADAKTSLSFFEPGGLSVLEDKSKGGPLLFVADTNNHRIVRINLVTPARHEIAFAGLSSPPLTKGGPGGVRSPDESNVIQAPPIAITPGKDVVLLLDIQLPAGAHLNPDAPWHVEVSCDGTTLHQQTGKSPQLPLLVTIPAARVIPDKPWLIAASLTYCSDSNGGLCVPADVAWRTLAQRGDRAHAMALQARVSA